MLVAKDAIALVILFAAVLLAAAEAYLGSRDRSAGGGTALMP
jgi:hypothetical protein